MLWELTDYLVFVDGRTDLYNDEILSEWLQVVRAEEGWQGILDKWEVNLIMLDQDAQVNKFLEDAEWELIYIDKRSVIYRR